MPYSPPIGSYETMGETLQNILTKRAVQRHQDLMNQLQPELQQAQIANMQSEAEYRKSMAGYEQQRMDMEKQKNAQLQAMNLPTDAPLTPEQAKLGEQAFPGSTYQKPGTEAVPAVNPQPGDQGYGVLQPQEAKPASPATTMFRGTPAFQHQQKISDAYGKIAQQVQNKSMTPEDALFAMFQADPEKADAGTFERWLQSKAASGGRRLIFNESRGIFTDATGKPVTDANVNDMVSSLPRPPQGPTPSYEWREFKLKDGTTAVGVTSNRVDKKSGVPIIVDASGNPLNDKIAGFNKIGATPKVASLPPQDSAAIEKARAAYADKKGWHMPMMGGAENEARTRADLNQRMLEGFGHLAEGDQQMISAAQTAFSKPDWDDTPSTDIAKGMVTAGRISAEKAEAFANALAQVRGL